MRVGWRERKERQRVLFAKVEEVEIESGSKEFRELINNEYQNQRLNNLLSFSLDEVFYRINFSHIFPSCYKAICSDILKKDNIRELIFHQINKDNEFKILKPKKFLNEVI